MKGAAAAGVALCGLYAVLPLGSALQLGGDEGYELSKALLVSKGWRLYTDIWSDQPPLYTLLLGGGFRLLGPSILVGRLMAAAFGLVLYLAFLRLVRQRSSGWAAAAALFLLLASPGVLQQSVSVMLEVPAIAMGRTGTNIKKELEQGPSEDPK